MLSRWRQPAPPPAPAEVPAARRAVTELEVAALVAETLDRIPRPEWSCFECRDHHGMTVAVWRRMWSVDRAVRCVRAPGWWIVEYWEAGEAAVGYRAEGPELLAYLRGALAYLTDGALPPPPGSLRTARDCAGRTDGARVDRSHLDCGEGRGEDGGR